MRVFVPNTRMEDHEMGDGQPQNLPRSPQSARIPAAQNQGADNDQPQVNLIDRQIDLNIANG